MITLVQIQKELQENIRYSGLKQIEIAKKLNVKPQTIAAYLSGKAMPALDTFANLCVILDVDPADILCTNSERK